MLNIFGRQESSYELAVEDKERYLFRDIAYLEFVSLLKRSWIELGKFLAHIVRRSIRRKCKWVHSVHGTSTKSYSNISASFSSYWPLFKIWQQQESMTWTGSWKQSTEYSKRKLLLPATRFKMVDNPIRISFYAFLMLAIYKSKEDHVNNSNYPIRRTS